jgi:hypothetical protein
MKEKFKELKQTILDIILIKVLSWNPNHCFKKEWLETEKKNKEYRLQGEKYFKEANNKYNDLQPIKDLSYNKELYYKFLTDEARYKTMFRLIIENNGLQEVKKDFDLALKENRYIVKIGLHKSIELDLSTCKRLVDDVEAVYKEYGTTDYVKLFKHI